MKNKNVVVKNQVILNRGLYRWAAPRSVFVRGLVNYRFQDLQRLLLQLISNVRGRCQIKFGMTSLCNNSGRRGFTLGRHPELDSGSRCSNNQSGEIPNQVWNDIPFGFTLIELLVVVLIIGILAAIALPQYQKAVKKTYLAEWAAYVNAYTKAVDLWLLTNGHPSEGKIIEFTGESTSPRIHADLDIKLACEGNAELPNQCATKIGQFHVGCGSVHCWSNLASSNRKFKLIKQDEQINVNRYVDEDAWMLHSVVLTDASAKKLICQYWKEHYGVNRMREDAKSACAAVGIE